MLVLLLFLGVLAKFQSAKACFEIIPKIHSVTCYYDSSHFRDFAVRVGSFRTAANPAGTWCTLAIWHNSPLLSQINYIAIVDSGTTNRTPGYPEWRPDAGASSAWDTIYNIHWNAFLTQLVSATTSGQPVEIIIRCNFTVGYALIPMMADIRNALLGWANWDDSLHFPSAINRWWLDWPADSFVFVPIHKPSPFFSNLDADLLYVGNEPLTVNSLHLSVFPNPARDFVHLETSGYNAIRSVEIFDANGKLEMTARPLVPLDLDLDVRQLIDGLHFARIHTVRGDLTKRILIAR
jgi:hypothetical protein